LTDLGAFPNGMLDAFDGNMPQRAQVELDVHGLQGRHGETRGRTRGHKIWNFAQHVLYFATILAT